MNLKLKTLVVLMPMLLTALAQAEEAQDIKLDAVVVKGILPENLESVPGSYNIVDEKELEARRPFSIKEHSSVPFCFRVECNTFPAYRSPRAFLHNGK